MNVRKAARPDGITGRVLRSCTDHLAGLFTFIFNETLATSVVPKNGNYVRLLFIDYSSVFNTKVPIMLAFKLSDLGLNSSLCDWIKEFLTGRPQVVKVGQFTSNSITLNVGAPQGCVLSPLLYSLYTHTTACPLTTPLLLSNLLMIQWLWASFSTMMRPHTWMR